MWSTIEIQRWIACIGIVIVAICLIRRELRIIREMNQAYDDTRKHRR